MRKLILFIVVLGFLAIYFYTNKQTETSFLNKSINTVRKMMMNSSSNPEQAKKEAQENSISTQGASPNINSFDQTQNLKENSNENLQNLTPEELKKWISIEAHSMNSTSLDSDSKQIELKAQAQTLDIKQLVVLGELAVNSNYPINDRILSAYLISLNPETQSLEILFNVAKTEVPSSGPITPHSESEIKNSQELAIRYMQIDELFMRAKTNANAYDKLRALSEQAASAQIRSYAQKKLQELK